MICECCKKEIREKPVNADTILEIICEEYGVTEWQLKRRLRKGELVWARQSYYYLAKKYASAPMVATAARFGRDHTTAVHGVQKVRMMLATADPLIGKLTAAENRIRGMIGLPLIERAVRNEYINAA